MNIDDIVTLGRDALLVTLLASAPMLVAGLIVGLVISVLQSVTQIQEITLSFVPKIIAVMVSFVLFLPWIVSVVMKFSQPIFSKFDTFLR